MILDYINAAMHQTDYERSTDDGTYAGQIPVFPGVTARNPSLAQCRERLSMALENSILLRTHFHLRLPIINDLDLNILRGESEQA
jgi:hypothetical protein